MRVFNHGQGHGTGYQHLDSGFGDGIGYGDICGGGGASGMNFCNGNGVSRYNYNPISKWKKGDGGFNYPHELIQYWNER